jgi:hypothetical protein
VTYATPGYIKGRVQIPEGVTMSIIPTILRAVVIGIASVVPENSPLDSVVFRSSLQIMLGVSYVIVFYIASALVKVLTGRGALMDPTASQDLERQNVRSGKDHPYEFRDAIGADDDWGPGPEKYPLALDGDFEHDDGNKGLIVRVGRDVERRVRRIASVVTSQNTTPYTDNGCHVAASDDHSPARPRTGSVDGRFSVSSEDDEGGGVGVSHAAAGVQERGRRERKPDALAPDSSSTSAKSVAYTKMWAELGTVRSSSSLRDPILRAPASPSQSPGSITRREAARIHTPSHMYRGGSVPIPETDQGIYLKSDRIYTDVYGLGFAAFVLHYTMDCSSMQPTIFLLLGLTILGARDVSVIALSASDGLLPQTTLFTRALTVFAFILLVISQICMIVGIVRVPSYHTDARDGTIMSVPAPETMLEHILARVLPVLAPLALYMVSKRTSVAADVSKTLRRAMPTTVLIAVWFITCFGAMSDQLRTAVGATSVNATVAELSQTDVAVNMQLPLLIFSPFLKIPALIAIVSCCLTRKTMDIVAALCIVFYAKQILVVRDIELLQMLNVAFVFATLAWVCLTLRYCTSAVRCVADLFEKKSDAKV